MWKKKSLGFKVKKEGQLFTTSPYLPPHLMEDNRQ